jgi:hypothetical protein
MQYTTIDNIKGIASLLFIIICLICYLAAFILYPGKVFGLVALSSFVYIMATIAKGVKMLEHKDSHPIKI